MQLLIRMSLVIGGLALVLMVGVMSITRHDQPGVSFIAYERLNGNQFTIYRTNPDGAQTRKITEGAQPTWSPDGQWIAYVRKNDVFRINFAATRIDSIPVDFDIARPVWAPTHPALAFENYRNTLYLINSDGSDSRRLAAGIMPNWSPDGQRVVYAYGYPPYRDICQIEIKEPRADCLSTDKADDLWPAWSPDGEWIAFASSPGARAGRLMTFGLYKMRPDGTETQPIISVQYGHAYAPAWSPDGEWIAFVADWDGSFNLYRVRADGTDVQQLTRGTDVIGAPAWSALLGRPFNSARTMAVGLGLILVGIMRLVSKRISQYL